MPINVVIWRRTARSFSVAILEHELYLHTPLSPSDRANGLGWGDKSDQEAVVTAIKAVPGVEFCYMPRDKPSILLFDTHEPTELDSDLVAHVLSIISRYVAASDYYGAYPNVALPPDYVAIGVFFPTP